MRKDLCVFYRRTDFLSVLLLLIWIIGAHAQINTEAMRKEDVKPGFHFEAGGDVGYVDGNSSLFQNRSNLRLDYVQDWGLVFLVANYRLNMKDKLLFINKGFSHLRTVKRLRSPLYGEIFLQQEFNEFIQIEDRKLIGSGLRIKWNELDTFIELSQKLTLISGMGLMWEREKIDTGPDGTEGDPIHGDLASLLRSTNYMVLNWTPKPGLGLLTTTYFQFDTKRLSDYRILGRSTLKVSLSKRLSVTLNLNIRYDSEPPGKIEPLDVDFQNGFSYKFK
ncbi:DUF481 domain-containing protein [Candidatus Neomarinimicrobiota bacterium]